VYLNRKLHAWGLFGSGLASVVLDNIRGINVLVFVYSAITYPPQLYTVRVPVPNGQEETAKAIVQQFNLKI
jgi:hypothetical protein